MIKWSVIKDINKNYSISNNGNVVNNRNGKILKNVLDKNGYYQVTIFNANKNKRTNCKIHRLVAENFIENKLNKKCVNHKDGNKKNNNINNLEWCTYGENNKHAYDNNLKTTNFSYLKNELHYKTYPILQMRNDVVVNEFKSQKEAEEKTGIARQNISKVINGKRNMAGGFEWRAK